MAKRKKKPFTGDAAKMAVFTTQLDDEYKVMDMRGVCMGKHPRVSRMYVRAFSTKKNDFSDPKECLYECGYCGAVYKGRKPPRIVASMDRTVYRCAVCEECDGIMWVHKLENDRHEYVTIERD